ncbi:hypothetical protein BYT27DRAFT_7252788 [Phlegmacium glaucopus]|nr:hypothetical protein BYT27DRAFT_7252788 [Phlegmacium glaucopus]
MSMPTALSPPRHIPISVYGLTKLVICEPPPTSLPAPPQESSVQTPVTPTSACSYAAPFAAPRNRRRDKQSFYAVLHDGLGRRRRIVLGTGSNEPRLVFFHPFTLLDPSGFMQYNSIDYGDRGSSDIDSSMSHTQSMLSVSSSRLTAISERKTSITEVLSTPIIMIPNPSLPPATTVIELIYHPPRHHPQPYHHHPAPVPRNS